MLITVEFADRGGQTEILLTHENMSNEASRRFHRAGWRWGVKRLAKLLAGERSVQAQRLTARPAIRHVQVILVAARQELQGVNA